MKAPIRNEQKPNKNLAYTIKNVVSWFVQEFENGSVQSADLGTPPLHLFGKTSRISVCKTQYIVICQ